MRAAWVRLLISGVILTLASAGCEERELAAMRKVGQRVLDKGETWLQAAGQRLGVPPVPEAAAAGTQSDLLAQRVRHRLLWDRKLAELAIIVQVQGDEVRLSGSVANEDLRRRAVELAETTVGVGKVTTGWSDAAAN
jgi:predicted oxidoreductase